MLEKIKIKFLIYDSEKKGYNFLHEQMMDSFELRDILLDLVSKWNTVIIRKTYNGIKANYKIYLKN